MSFFHNEYEVDQMILGTNEMNESQLPEAVTRNMPKTVLWLLRHRASRQNYGVCIFNVGEPVSRAVVSPVVRVFG